MALRLIRHFRKDKLTSEKSAECQHISVKRQHIKSDNKNAVKALETGFELSMKSFSIAVSAFKVVFLSVTSAYKF